MRRPLIMAALSVAILLTACAENDDDPSSSATASDGGGQAASSSAMGPGLSVGAAMESSLEGPLLVNGYVVVTEEEIRFCESLTTSRPPECDGESLTIEGLDEDALEGLTRDSGISWSDEPTQLLGDVEGDRLVLSGNAIG